MIIFVRINSSIYNLTWLEELENEKLDLICTMISQGFTYEQ